MSIPINLLRWAGTWSAPPTAYSEYDVVYDSAAVPTATYVYIGASGTNTATNPQLNPAQWVSYPSGPAPTNTETDLQIIGVPPGTTGQIAQYNNGGVSFGQMTSGIPGQNLTFTIPPNLALHDTILVTIAGITPGSSTGTTFCVIGVGDTQLGQAGHPPVPTSYPNPGTTTLAPTFPLAALTSNTFYATSYVFHYAVITAPNSPTFTFVLKQGVDYTTLTTSMWIGSSSLLNNSDTITTWPVAIVVNLVGL